MKSFKQFMQLNEVTLSGKATDGRPSVEKYVTDNPKALEITFEIERGKKDVEAWDNNTGEVTRVLQAGDKFKLKSKTLYDYEGQYALDTEYGLILAKEVRKPSGFKAMDAEVKATNELDGLIKAQVKGGKGIDIKIGKFTIKDVVSASSSHIKGDPKADIALIDSSGKEVGFISHKKEGGAKAFQQYSGFSPSSGLLHKEIDSFIDAVDKQLKGKSPSQGDCFYRFVKDNKLINQSVYGPSYPGTFGRDNCHCIGQGNPVLSKKGSSYELTFSETMHVNGDVSWAKKGKYVAIFAVTFRNGRRIMNPKTKKEIRNVRGGIYPIDFIRTRKKAMEI